MQTQFTKKQIIFLAAAGALVLVIILILVGIIPGRRVTNIKTANLMVWGVDAPDAWKNTIDSFRKVSAGAKIEYRQFREDSYEKDVINALAESKGPDIFMFDNNWLLKHKNKIVPIPQDKMSVSTLKSLFPQAVEKDFILGDRIYALPLYIDTLALVYNRDHFDQAGIAASPITWAELDLFIPQLKRVDENNQLTRSPFAIGGSSENIENAPDLLNLFLLQTGSTIVDEKLTQTLFYNEAGINALSKYIFYSNPNSDIYSWSTREKNDFDKFAKGDASAIFAYKKQLEKVRAKNSLLNWAVGSMPQVNDLSAVNYPNYYGLAVSNSALDLNVAWDFVVFAATDKGSAEFYSRANNLPPALRFLIDVQKNDPGTDGIYARQALTARSWLQPDPVVITDFFDEAIRNVLDGSLDSQQSLEKLSLQIENLLR